VEESLDYDGPDPLWKQVADIIRGQIKSGELAPGRRVPSENDLTQQYGIARGTAKKALDSLVHEGLVRRVQGKGTFVR
jgi:DNA-binding GntR family transcriptional regulator